jgi:NADP-dependent 3-hydroxy acid dehydrogenase YdfG
VASGGGALDGKVALVVGASSGMGLATARLFAKEGAAVGLMARRKEILDALAEEIGAAGERAYACPADLEDGPSTRQAVDAAVAHFGRLDVLAIVAGTNLKARALTVLDPADWQMMVDTNLSAAFHLTQAALPQMRRQHDGLIIYVSTFAVQRPDKSGVAYQATKHGMVGLCHGTQEEERENGIRTTMLFPGLTETPLLEKRPVPTPPEIVAKALQPEDVAQACLFVASLPARVRVPELQIVPSAL